MESPPLPSSSPAPSPSALRLVLPLLTGVSLALASCHTASSIRQADREVYRALEKIQDREQLPNPGFSIDTPYSGRDPGSIEPGEILESRALATRRKISIEEAHLLAIESSRDYQTRREGLYLTALNFTGERHRFRPQLFARSQGTQSWLPRRDGPGTSESFTTVNTELGFSQAFASGASLALTFANDLLRYHTGDPRRSAVSVISLNVVQPLLRGTGHRIAAENLTQSFRNAVYEVRDYSHFQSEFIRDITVSYFRLLQDRDSVTNAYSDYTSRVNATSYLRARSVDRENPLDVRQAEQAELSAKNRYIDSVVRLQDSLDAFKLRLGVPITTRLVLDEAELNRLRTAGLVPLRISRDAAVSLALDHRLPLRNQIDRFEDARRQITVAADALQPGLNFVGNAAFLSEEPLNYLDFSFSNLQADVALQLDLPVNRKLERNAYRATLVRFEEEVRSLGLTMDTLRRDIDRRIRQLDQFALNYAIQQKAVEQARLRVEGAQLKLAAGTAIFRDLEEAQDALIAAQNALTAALVDHLEARLSLLVDLGILDWEKSQFWLSPAASKVPLPKVSPQRSVEDSILRGDEVIPPHELFPGT